MLINAEIHGRGRAGRLGQGRLVHHHDLIDLFVAADGFHKPSGLILGGILADELAMEDIAHERGFARAGNTCHGAEHAERELRGEVLDIVVGNAFESDLPLGLAAFFGNRDGFFALEVIGCKGVFCRCKILRWAAVEEFSAGNTTAGTDIHQLVGGSDHGFFVFDHEECVSLVAKALHDLDEAGCVARMESNAGLVEDEKGIDEGGAEAGREIDALDFAARERAGGAVERQVAQADLAEVVDAGNNLLVDEARAGIRGGKFERLQDRREAFEWDGGDIRNREARWIDAEIQRIRLEAAAVAFRAGLVAAVTRKQHPHMHFVGFAFEPLKIAVDPIPRTRVPGFSRRDIRIAMNDKILIGLGKPLERTHGIDAAFAAVADEIILALGGLTALEGADDSLGDGKGPVRDDALHVYADDASETFTLGTGTQRGVEGKKTRRGRADVGITRRAMPSRCVGVRCSGVGVDDG